MDKEQFEQWFGAVCGVIGISAIVINVFLMGPTLENALDGLKDIAGLIVAVGVFLVAVRLERKSTDPFATAAEKTLTAFCRRHGEWLTGPESSKKDYVPDTTSNALPYYVFFRSDRYPRRPKKKVALFPSDPMAQGIIDVRVSKSTMLVMGYDSQELDKMMAAVQAKVRENVLDLLRSKYEGKYAVLLPPDEASEPDPESPAPKANGTANSAVVIDLDEKAMGRRLFAKALSEICETAFLTILQFKK